MSKKPCAEDVLPPAPLDTQAFKSVWADWLTHLREAGKRPTTIYARDSLAVLASLGETGAIECLKTSIRYCRTWFNPSDLPQNPTLKRIMHDDTQDLLRGGRA